MKSHLNLRHTINFIVLQGFVNQRKEVSGRLYFEKQTNINHSLKAENT